jgi:GT2 family glycosyltransferase
MLVSFVIPTQNRHKELVHTIEQLTNIDLDMLGGNAELIIVNNGSDIDLRIPAKLQNGIVVEQVDLDKNYGVGARNIGVDRAHGDWVIMLDDDSSILPGSIGEYLSRIGPHVGAVGGEIFLPDGSHEAGGLPEVFVGCGCAIRRKAFLEVGGYDSSFGYYAEEYDLCAKLIRNGYSIHHTQSLRFLHRKTMTGRVMNEILYRLVRNNGWVIERYAPDEYRDSAIQHMIKRYMQIAEHECAMDGYERGLNDYLDTKNDQVRQPLDHNQWDRFVGKAAIQSMVETVASQGHKQISLVGPSRGKGRGLIASELKSRGVFAVDENHSEHESPHPYIIATLSPGPILDCIRKYPQAMAMWDIEPVAIKI